MAYKIEYSKESAHRYPQSVKKQREKTGIWILLVGMLVSVLWLRINGIPDWLIPGDPNVTRAAASAFISEMKDGASVNDAITVFCRTVLDGAEF